MSGNICSVEQIKALVEGFSIMYNIPQSHIVVGGGCALIVLGMRETTQDVNLWVRDTHFYDLAEKEKVICHPMTDTAFKVKMGGIEFWIRKYNPYHPYISIDRLNVYDILPLVVMKRDGVLRVERPLDKRKQDRLDLICLEKVFSKRNKVAS